jgi:small-conductance mechanosensitive channel
MSRRFQAVSFAGAFLCLLAALYASDVAGEKGYPVLLDGKPVIEVRWGNAAVPAEQRAGMITDRLKNVADDYRVPPKVTLTTSESSIISLTAGDKHIVSVFPEDARAAGMDANALAQEWAKALEGSITDYRGQRSWKRRIQSVALALLTIAGTIVVLSLIRKFTTRLAGFCVRRFESRIAADDRKVIAVVARSRVLPAILAVCSWIRLVASLIVIFFGFQLLLFYFPRTKVAATGLFSSVLAMITGFLSTAWKHAPDVAFLVVLAVATWYALRFSTFIFRGLGEGTLTIEGFRPAWATTTQRIVSLALIILAVLIAYPYIPGSESPAFKGVSIFIGLLVSLGSTGLMANVVTGIMLTYMDAFHVGDFIQFDERFARVERMSMLTTQLRTRWNEVLTIPNSLILSKEVANLSLADHRGIALRCTVGVGYDAPWRQVESMMKLAAMRTEGVSRDHEPYVYTLALNQFDVTYELTVYLETGSSYFETRSRLNRNVLDAFNEFDVQIMTPAYEGDPEGRKVVPKSQWFAAPSSPKEAAAKAETHDNTLKQAG